MSNENTPSNKVMDLKSVGGGKFSSIVKNAQFEAIHVVIQAGRSLPPYQASRLYHCAMF